ncbi:MAG: hypothetical protein R3B96_20795 [Pirellulaceae bacterium]
MPRVRALLLPPMFFCAATAALVTACPTQMRAQEWKVSPTSLRITDAFDRHQLLVETESLDLTRQATYESLDSSVVGIDDWGRVTPLAQGSTRIVVRWNGEAREIPVVVSEFSLARPVSFANEIEPLLTRQGCNAGGCHGKASGQNGFRLSLFGFDAEFDHEAIVKSSRGRRIDFAARARACF